MKTDKRQIEQDNFLGELLMASPCKPEDTKQAWVELRIDTDNLQRIEYKIHTCQINKYTDTIHRMYSMYTTDLNKAMDYFLESFKEM